MDNQNNNEEGLDFFNHPRYFANYARIVVNGTQEELLEELQAEKYLNQTMKGIAEKLDLLIELQDEGRIIDPEQDFQVQIDFDPKTLNRKAVHKVIDSLVDLGYTVHTAEDDPLEAEFLREMQRKAEEEGDFETMNATLDYIYSADSFLISWYQPQEEEEED